MSDRGLCGSRREEIKYGATFRRVAGDNEERERGGFNCIVIWILEILKNTRYHI